MLAAYNLGEGNAVERKALVRSLQQMILCDRGGDHILQNIYAPNGQCYTLHKRVKVSGRSREAVSCSQWWLCILAAGNGGN